MADGVLGLLFVLWAEESWRRQGAKRPVRVYVYVDASEMILLVKPWKGACGLINKRQQT